MWEDGGSGGGAGCSSIVKYSECFKNQDAIFAELMRECKHSAPGARLSARLRASLERLRPEERAALVARTQEGCAALFVASKRGNAEIVDYLVHVAGAQLEQRGLYEVADDRSVHSVTPLWCAAVEGRLQALRALADAGAALDAPSDSGSTPVRSACFMTHLEVVQFLVSRGADIHRPNHNGGTCLINSVQSVRLCTFLLEQGAEVNAMDIQHKTALHYAIQEHRVETARLLLAAGAEAGLVSAGGEDALRTACLRGAAAAAALLARQVRYGAGALADGYELLGATQLDEFNDLGAALLAWRRATALRHAGDGYVQKTPVLEAIPALENAREWRTMAELDALATDMDALRTQALLVAARVLGPHHKDTVLRLMYRGASYGDAFRYQRCIDLWMWALELRIKKDTLLFADTCHTACALTRLMLDAHSGRLERARNLPARRDVMAAYRLIADSLPESRAALEARPIHRKQAETFDRVLRCVTHLIYLLIHTETTEEERAETDAALRPLVAADVRSASTGDSLLHLSVSCLNVIRSTYFADELQAPPVFPCEAVVVRLVAAGAAAGARNGARSTALHVAAAPYNFVAGVVAALVAGGAHADSPNRHGDRADRLPPAAAALHAHTTLRCRAAHALLAAPHHRRLLHALPRELADFLDLHRP